MSANKIGQTCSDITKLATSLKEEVEPAFREKANVILLMVADIERRLHLNQFSQEAQEEEQNHDSNCMCDGCVLERGYF